MSDALREAASALKESLAAPISDIEELRQLLTPPLRFLGLPLAGPVSPSAWTSLSPDLQLVFVDKHLPAIQTILIERIYVDWHEHFLQDPSMHDLFDQWFCPTWPSSMSILVHLSSLVVLLKSLRALHPLAWDRSLSFLAQPTSLKDLHQAIATTRSGVSAELAWSDALKTVFAVPAKAANAAQERQTEFSNLEWGPYMALLANSFVDWLESEARRRASTAAPRMAEALIKFINTGFCTFSTTKDSFWGVVIPRLWPNCFGSSGYAPPFLAMLLDIGSRELAVFSVSLLTELSARYLPQGPSQWSVESSANDDIAACAALLSLVYGQPDSSDTDSAAWQVITDALIPRESWSPVMARLVVQWIAFGKDHTSAFLHFLDLLVPLWADKTEIAVAPLHHRQMLATAIVLSASQIPVAEPRLVKFSRSKAFMDGIQNHVASLRVPVRLLGLLVAEILSKQSMLPDSETKPLDFGQDIWGNQNEATQTCQSIRGLTVSPIPVLHHLPKSLPASIERALRDSNLPNKDVIPLGNSLKNPITPSLPQLPSAKPAVPANKPKITILSSTSESDDEDLVPYPMTVEENTPSVDLEDLSTYTPSKKKPARPVYIPDLSKYLKAREDWDKIEIALQYAADLIRKKAGWGTELEEHAVDLMFALIGIQNSVDLPEFEEQQLSAIQALLVGAPTKAVPTLVEQYFSQNYSIAQRSMMLAALAIASRELAGRPIPGFEPEKLLVAPSKSLPAPLAKRITASALDTASERLLLETLSKVRRDGQAALPVNGKHKLLSVRNAGPAALQQKTRPVRKTFADMAQDVFVMPLINRLWQALEDLPSLANAPNSSDGLPALFSPMLLSKYFSTLAVVLDCARFSPYFLAVLVPEAMELCFATRQLATAQEVEAAQLELLVVALEASYTIDQGRTLLSARRDLVFAAKDWAQEAWTAEEQSSRDPSRTAKAAAGLILRIESIVG